MGAVLTAVTLEAYEPAALAEFWSGVLGWRLSDDAGVALDVRDDTGGAAFRLRFVASDEPKVGQNQQHFDLTSTSLEDQQRTVARALELGARHLDIGQRPEEGHVVLADPEGNEFCVIGPGNNFLAGCPFLGCVTCDGSQAVGYFWSAALGWPLVWDQEEETAIQSPQGGPKISWGGWRFDAKAERRRVHFDLAPAEGSDQQTELDRVLSLGATRLDFPSHDAGAVVLADPDGNEFCLTP